MTNHSPATDCASIISEHNNCLQQCTLVLGNLIYADLSPVLLCDVPFADISSKIAVPDRPKNSDENRKKFVGVAENYAAGKKMFTDQPFLDSPENGKAMEEETERANQQVDEEADKKKPDNLVALGNKVHKLSTMITGIDKRIATMSDDFKKVSENVRKQATTSYASQQDVIERVNLLQQSYDSCMETQTHILSLVMEISNRLGVSVDEVKKGEERLGKDSCGVEANQEKNDGDEEKDD